MNELAVWTILAAAGLVAIAVTRINPILGYSRLRVLNLALLAGLVALLVVAAAWEETPRIFPATASGVMGPDGG